MDVSGAPATASVIICAYTDDRWATLLAAIDSVAAQTRPAHEVVVVVDHNEGLMVRLREARSDVEVVPNSGGKGLSGARSTGVGMISGDIAVFLDDDAVAAPDWLAELVAPFDDPAVAGVGGWVEPLWAGGCPAWWPTTFHWVVGCSYTGLPGAGAEIRNPIGAAMAIRSHLVRSAGGFVDGIGRTADAPMGCEETELCIRVARTNPGVRFLHQPSAVVHHHVGGDRASFRYFARRCLAEGRSKAAVAQLTGADAALAQERGHALRTIPRAMVDDLLTPRSASPGGPSRAAAAAAGTVLTAWGYARGRAAAAVARTNA